LALSRTLLFIHRTDEKDNRLSFKKEKRRRIQMDRPEKFLGLNSSEKRFRKPFGFDSKPRSASYQECRDAIERGIQGLEKHNFSVRELKDQANVVSNWIETHKFDFSPKTKDDLKELWNKVHNKFLDYKYLKYSQRSAAQEVKEALANYLHYAREQIEAIWKEQQDQFKNLNITAKADIYFIRKHYNKFQEIGYNFGKFSKIIYKASSLQKELQGDFNDRKDIDQNNKNLFIGYCSAIHKMFQDLYEFLEIGPDSEARRVSERKARIEKLLEDLPELRPTLSDLPRKQWWKLYLDAPMHKEAQKLSDPGRFFDQDASPGYQRSMINLFDKVLVPAKSKSQKDMNYNHYTEIHNIATKYVPHNEKIEMRKSGGIYEDYTYSLYRLKSMGGSEIQERLKALQEMREERINGLPLFQNWQSEEDFREQIVWKIAESPRQAITVGWVIHDYTQTSEQGDKFYAARPGYTIMIPAYLEKEVPQHVNTILKSYYEGRDRPNQTEYQRLTEIAKTVRALHVMHPKTDGNGRTNIFGLMNKWLIEEGFTPAILPNGPEVFGGIKTLDGLVEDMLRGMHSFMEETKSNKKK